MIKMPTTTGNEEMASSIAAFKIGESGNVETPGLISDPLLLALQQALGEDQYNAYFGSGNELQGFGATGQVEVNGVSVDQSSVAYLLNQIMSNTYQIQSITVE